MVVYIRGGPDARIEVPMMMFQNANSSYPINGLLDDVPGVTYRSGPKDGCTDGFFLNGSTHDVCKVT